MTCLSATRCIASMIAALSLIFAVARCTAEEPLRWNLKAGQTLQCTRTQERTMHTIVNGMDHEEKSSRITDMTLTVERVATDGTARVIQKIDRIRVKSKSVRGGERGDRGIGCGEVEITNRYRED